MGCLRTIVLLCATCATALRGPSPHFALRTLPRELLLLSTCMCFALLLLVVAGLHLATLLCMRRCMRRRARRGRGGAWLGAPVALALPRWEQCVAIAGCQGLLQGGAS